PWIALEKPFRAREDQVEVQAYGRHQDTANHEDAEQHRLGDDAGPVIAAHVSAERDNAQEEELPRGAVFGAFPQDEGPDSEQAGLEKEPEQGRDQSRQRQAADLAPNESYAPVAEPPELDAHQPF